MRTTFVFVALLAALPFAACSSSSSSPSGSGGDGGASSGDAGGGPTSTCVCNISFNGVDGTVQCGQSGCINDTTFTCDSSANPTQGGTCSSTGGGDSGTASGCSLFTCNTTADCGGVAPCFSTSTAGTNYCYEQEGSPSECSSGTTATTKTTSNGSTTICVPSTCPQPVNFLQ